MNDKKKEYIYIYIVFALLPTVSFIFIYISKTNSNSVSNTIPDTREVVCTRREKKCITKLFGTTLGIKTTMKCQSQMTDQNSLQQNSKLPKLI